MDLSELQTLLSRLKGGRTVCVGDLMVDRFVHGEAARLSAEAPVPIMSHGSQILPPWAGRCRCWAWSGTTRSPIRQPN